MKKKIDTSIVFNEYTKEFSIGQFMRLIRVFMKAYDEFDEDERQRKGEFFDFMSQLIDRSKFHSSLTGAEELLRLIMEDESIVPDYKIAMYKLIFYSVTYKQEEKVRQKTESRLRQYDPRSMTSQDKLRLILQRVRAGIYENHKDLLRSIEWYVISESAIAEIIREDDRNTAGHVIHSVMLHHMFPADRLLRIYQEAGYPAYFAHELLQSTKLTMCDCMWLLKMITFKDSRAQSASKKQWIEMMRTLPESEVRDLSYILTSQRYTREEDWSELPLGEGFFLFELLGHSSNIAVKLIATGKLNERQALNLYRRSGRSRDILSEIVSRPVVDPEILIELPEVRESAHYMYEVSMSMGWFDLPPSELIDRFEKEGVLSFDLAQRIADFIILDVETLYRLLDTYPDLEINFNKYADQLSPEQIICLSEMPHNSHGFWWFLYSSQQKEGSEMCSDACFVSEDNVLLEGVLPFVKREWFPDER